MNMTLFAKYSIPVAVGLTTLYFANELAKKNGKKIYGDMAENIVVGSITAIGAIWTLGFAMSKGLKEKVS